MNGSFVTSPDLVFTIAVNAPPCMRSGLLVKARGAYTAATCESSMTHWLPIHVSAGIPGSLRTAAVFHA
ncbi:hypothetical protein [Streptomyces thioluteus]|uniref:hypothetical protein n=1 Tax=Streptomyces thioluteus TaxID=66431 RepID=UPI0031EB0D35